MVQVTIEEQKPVPVEAGAVAVVDLSGGQGGGGELPEDVMRQKVYDVNGKETDIFDYADGQAANASNIAMHYADAKIGESTQALSNAEIDTILGV